MRAWLAICLLALTLAGCTPAAQTKLAEENRRLAEENQKLSAENERLTEENQNLTRLNQVLGEENGMLRSHEAAWRAELAKGKDATIPAKLINAHYRNPEGGTEGWTYRKSTTADLDGDGHAERITLVSNAAIIAETKTVAWDDGHIWHVYVDAPDGTRTVVFADWVQMGLLEVGVDTENQRLILVRGGGWYTTIYQVRYRGPNQIEAVELLSYQMHERATFPPGQHYQE